MLPGVQWPFVVAAWQLRAFCDSIVGVVCLRDQGVLSSAFLSIRQIMVRRCIHEFTGITGICMYMYVRVARISVPETYYMHQRSDCIQ